MDVFLPFTRRLSRRSDRTRWVEVPLFGGYLFVRGAREPEPRHAVLRTPGMVGLVSVAGQPVPVPDEQVESVRAVVASGRDATPCPYLGQGRQVVIASGPLAGVEGVVVAPARGARCIVVSVDILGRSVAVTLDQGDVEIA